MDSLLLTRPQRVVIRVGGDPVFKGADKIDVTIEGEAWIAHSLQWGKKFPVALWVLSLDDPSIGAWVDLDHVVTVPVGRVPKEMLDWKP